MHSNRAIPIIAAFFAIIIVGFALYIFMQNEQREPVSSEPNENEPVSSKPNGNESEESNRSENGNTNGESPEIVWGVDSASLTTEDMLACVRENFGEPKVWGRYLGDKENVSYGLTYEEVELLHSQEIRILVIWNHFEDATGYENGFNQASAAIQQARAFGISEGVALFANIEPIYPVDSSFLLGWYDALSESEYASGVYGIFHPDQELYVAFEAAANENPDLLSNTYIWTASPNEGITSEQNAPDYSPEGPEGAVIGGWQYGIDAETCNIDTNLFDQDLFIVLWY